MFFPLFYVGMAAGCAVCGGVCWKGMVYLAFGEQAEKLSVGGSFWTVGCLSAAAK